MSVKAADQVSLVDVTDGYSVMLTSESATFAGTTTGARSGSATTQVMCFQGSAEVGFSIGEITCPTGVSASVGSDGRTVTVTASSAMTEPGDVVIPVTIASTDVTIVKRFSCGIALAGEKGDAGTGISGSEVSYQIGTSGVDAPAGTWSKTPLATTSQGQYLWTRTVTTYTDGGSTTTYSVGAHGSKGEPGDKGDTGDTGNGVERTDVSYQLSPSGSTVPSGTWATTPLTPTATQYLWTRTVTTYTDGSTSTAYSVGGKAGAKGDAGPAGSDSLVMAITTNNGTVFRNSNGQTTLTAHVYLAGAELTESQIAEVGVINWYVGDSATPMSTGSTITVSASSVDSKAVYTARLEGDGEVSGKGTSVPVYDAKAGRYDNGTIQRWLAANADGLIYGVAQRKGAATGCRRLGANAGMSAPVPGVIGTPARDPFEGRGPFRHFEVNGGCDPDGSPYVTAFEGEGGFSREDHDTWVLAPTLWVRTYEDDDWAYTYWSDTEHDGFEPQPGATLPSGDRRPFMLYAKYWLGTGEGYSRSGQAPAVYDVSHDSLIKRMGSATTGYSGLSYADFWYARTSFLMKYATKDSQSVLSGCTSYWVDVAVAAATSGKRYVVVSNSDAASLLVGSTVSVGSRVGYKSDNRQEPCTHDLADRARIESIERNDDATMRVNLATEPFDCPSGAHVVTMPWHTGSCDLVEGDGSPTSNTSGREPFKLQGIELMGGAFEVLGDVILHQAESGPGRVYVNPDSKDERTSYDASAYVDTGLSVPSGDGSYPLYASAARGMLVPQGTGGSTTSGLCDIKWGADFTGDREYLSGGDLGGGGRAGLWCLGAWVGLDGAWWRIGSRASATGRGVRTA